MPLFGGGSELLPVWPPALLFLLVLRSAARAVVCFLRAGLWLKPLPEFPARVKAGPNRSWLKPRAGACHSWKNSPLE